MNDYKDASRKAKQKFALRLKGALQSSDLTKKHVFDVTGITRHQLSLAFKDEPEISEEVIRRITRIKGMENCYSEYRNEVDAPYLPANKDIAETQETRAQIDKALALVIASLQDVRKNLQDL